MSVLKGKAMFYAMRLFGHQKRDVTVKTPTAVAGVRGTKFGIHVYWDNESAGRQTGVRVAAAGGDTAMRIARYGDPDQTFTDCFSDDGVLDVNGRTVTPGNMYRGRDGAVVPTPPGFVRAFESETAVQGGETEGEEPAGQGEEDGDSEGAEAGEEDAGPGATADAADLVTDTTLIETGVEAAGGAAGENIAEGKTAGRISGIALLLVNDSGFPWYGPGKGPFYLHGPNPLGSGADTHRAYESEHEDEPDYRLFLQETDTSGSYAEVTEFDWGYGENKALAAPRTFTYFKGGHYQDSSGKNFLEWGWWEDTGGGADMGKIGEGPAGAFYAATGKIWHVEGDQTHPDYIAYLHQQNASCNYSGDAHGVFVDSTPPTPTSAHLAGAFSCTINFGSRRFSGFLINASGGGRTVHLSGSGSIDPDGTFDIENLSGTLSGHPTQDDPTHVGGAVAGPKTEGVAVAWEAHDGAHYWATGEFHGKRNSLLIYQRPRAHPGQGQDSLLWELLQVNC